MRSTWTAMLAVLTAMAGCQVIAGSGDFDFYAPGEGGAGVGGGGGMAPLHCENDELDGDETDVDCGGSCSPCGETSPCVEAGDCESGFCAEGTCAACVTTEDCAGAPGTYCETGACVPKKDNGLTCSAHEQCENGNCAPDGVCCNNRCDRSCEGCTEALTGMPDGECHAYAAGEDPEAECAATDPSTCGAKGMGCNGDADEPACVLHDDGTPCSDAACFNGVQSTSWTCDGLGSCTATSPDACDPYVCDDDGLACQTSCEDSADCDEDHYCNTTNNTCIPKIANGNSCSDAEQCASGFCPDDDGVCCDAACSGECESCLGALNGDTNGTCGFTQSGDPDDECPALQACNGQGMCALL